MTLLRVYLETTLFNFYVDKGRGFASESTLAFFREIAAGKYKAYTSSYVLDELEKASAGKRDQMLRLMPKYDISVLTHSSEAEVLADIYTAKGAIPQKYRSDGLHIAVATVNGLDMIVSMNFQHIVKRRTKLVTGEINRLNGYKIIEILSPMEVVGNEND